MRLLAVLLFLPMVAHGAITRTQNVSAAANNVAITSTSANDIIIVFAYFAGTATIPSLAGGFTSLWGTAGTGQAGRLGYKISAGGDTNSGTWTNATHVACMVFSGVNTASPFGTTPVASPGNGTNLSYVSGTLTVTDGTSVWLGFAGASSATAGMNGNTTGTAPNFTNRTNIGNRINGLDTAATATNLSTQTITLTTSGRIVSTTVELKATPVIPTVQGQFFQFF